jgi:hypothetical protein
MICNRGLGLEVGSKPIVFNIAPPHPSSKARFTILPFAVVGDEARMKGLGKSIPRNLIASEAIEIRSQILTRKKSPYLTSGMLSNSNKYSLTTLAVFAIGEADF